MKPEGKVRVFVRSRKIPARIVDVRTPVFSPSGIYVGIARDRHIVYETVLDEEHRKAIDEGRRLSCNLGLELEVVDRAKSGPFRRALSLLVGEGSPLINVQAPPTAMGNQGASHTLTAST